MSSKLEFSLTVEHASCEHKYCQGLSHSGQRKSMFIFKKEEDRRKQQGVSDKTRRHQQQV